MKNVILFSPHGYIGGFLKNRLQGEENIKLYEITRDSDLGQYKDDYDIMIYSAAVSNAVVDKYIQDNVVTAVLMVNFCKEHHIKRIIYLSSDSIYGEINTKVVTERSTMVNPGLYGTTKYIAEKIIEESEIPYYILRMPGVVGRVWRKNFISDLMLRIKKSEHIKLYNMNKDFNNILDIDDLTSFVVRLCNCGNQDKNEIFLLGNTERMKLEQVVCCMKDLYHSTSSISSIETDQKRYFTLDVTKAVEYGYSSKSIRTIINELYHIQTSEI